MPDDLIAGFIEDFKNGVPTPTANPADIRRMWEFTSKIREEQGATNAHIGFRPAGLPIGVPEASLGAVWVRTGLLDLLVQTGVLKPWTPGSEYEQRVFEVAANFPIRVGEFDEEEFLRQLGEGAVTDKSNPM